MQYIKHLGANLGFYKFENFTNSKYLIKVEGQEQDAHIHLKDIRQIVDFLNQFSREQVQYDDLFNDFILSDEATFLIIRELLNN